MALTLCVVMAAAAAAAGRNSHWKPTFSAAAVLSEADAGFAVKAEAARPRPAGRTVIGVDTELVSFKLDIGDITIADVQGQHRIVWRGGFRTWHRAGKPAVPRKVYRLTLPGEVHVSRVEIMKAKYVEIIEPLRVAPCARPQFRLARAGDGGNDVFKRDEKTYATDAFYPGRALSFAIGRRGGEQTVAIQLFPVQYNPATGLTRVLTGGEILVQYETLQGPARTSAPLRVENDPAIIGTDDPDTIECVIIYRTLSSVAVRAATTPPANEEQQNLEAFQEDVLNIDTFPMPLTGTNSIDALYNASDDPADPNYSADLIDRPAPVPRMSASDDNFWTYTDSSDPPQGWTALNGTYGAWDNTSRNTPCWLARKVISFLKDCKEEGSGSFYFPNLRYVILLGDGSEIPPANYMYDRQQWSWTQDDEYNSWVPTELFYASYDYDGDGYYDALPNLLVGRIPAKAITGYGTVAEIAQDHVLRMYMWYQQAFPGGDATVAWEDWFRRTSLWGGRVVDGWAYWGERFFVDYINRGLFEGTELTKRFWSRKTLTRANAILDLAEDADDPTDGMGFVLYGGHGNTDLLALSLGGNIQSAGDVLYVDDVLPILRTEGRLPVIITPTCMAGAWETGLTGTLFGAPAANETTISEALVMSRRVVPAAPDEPFGGGGSICFMGSSRTCYFRIAYPTFTDGVLDELSDLGLPALGDTMVENIVRAYSDYDPSAHGDDPTTLGNMFWAGMAEYATEEDVSGDVYDRRTLYEFVLLGNPCLPLPYGSKPDEGDRTGIPSPDITNNDGMTSIDTHRVEIAYGRESIQLRVDPGNEGTDDMVNIQLVDPHRDQSLLDVVDVSNTATYLVPVAVDDPSHYWVRVSAKDAQGTYDKEGWLYPTVVNEWVPPPNRTPASGAKILLVDDDQYDIWRLSGTWEETQVEDWFTDALDYLRVFDDSRPSDYFEYDVWDVDILAETGGQYGEVTQEALNYYRNLRSGDQTDGVVIWFGGDGNYTSLPVWTVRDINRLSSFLQNQGRLYISFQEFAWEASLLGGDHETFLQNYLKADSLSFTSGDAIIAAVADDPISGMMSRIGINDGDGAGNQAYPDVLDVLGGGAAFLNWEGSDVAAVRASDTSCATVCTAFGFEGIDIAGTLDDRQPNGRNLMMKKIVEWLRRPDNTVSAESGPSGVTAQVFTNSPRTISIGWTNPTAGGFPDLQGTIIVFRHDAFPQNRDDGTVAATVASTGPGANQRFDHANTDSTKDYYYALFSFDSGNTWQTDSPSDSGAQVLVAGEAAGGGGGGSSSICFVATAATEAVSRAASPVTVSNLTGRYCLSRERARMLDDVRGLRDRVLLATGPGSRFVGWYYAVGPYAAEGIRGREAAKTVVRRLAVTPLAELSKALGATEK